MTNTNILQLPLGASPLATDLLVGQPANGNPTVAYTPGQLAVIATGNTAGRQISSLFGDFGYNLKSLGALLDGSTGDNATIQTIYNGLASGSVAAVPSGSLWTGTINAPSNTKAVTWWALGENAFPTSGEIGADNDLFFTLTGATGNFFKNSLNSSASPAPPLQANYTNYSPNFSGPFSGNYAQYPAGNFQANSGPLATGNTSALQAVFASYGMNPAASYDVAFNIAMVKVGQTSTWPFNLFHSDATSRLPQGLASQSEFYYEANGWDVLPGSPSYYAAGPSNRYGIGLSFGTYPQNSWSANATVVTKGASQFSLVGASTIQYTATDGNAYVWVCQTGGVTGGTSPTFPVPTLVEGLLLSSGVLIVTSKTSGPNLAVNDYILIGTQLNACKITSLGTGSGAAGTYNTTSGFASNTNYSAVCTAGSISGTTFTVSGTYEGPFTVGMILTENNALLGTMAAGTVITGGSYPNFTVNISQTVASTIIEGYTPGPIIAAPNVTDGTAVWAFGTLYNGYFSAGLLISSDCNVGTGISFAGSYYQAGIDTTQSTFLSGAAAIRLGQNQWLDFTGNGTESNQNLRTFGYLTGDSALTYTVLGQNSFKLADGGAMYSLYNTLDDGSGNMSIHGTLAVTGAASGAGFTSLFASPPAIGGTAAAAGKFTTLSTRYNVLDDGLANSTFNGNMSVAGNLTISSTLDPNSSYGISGTTAADNAQAGSIGEVITNSATGVSLTSATSANLTSISLTAGDWDVMGSVQFVPAGTTAVTNQKAGVNSTTATLPAFPALANLGFSDVAGVGSAFAVPTVRVNVSTTTTYYLVGQATFSVSTLTASGSLIARRRR